MGAMAPPLHQWTPEDDVLLKNAVEAGASLESLAKGAVQFSRRYTFRELQDRWYSLLYDPVISKEALPQMFEVERSGFVSHPKLTKPDDVKEIPFGSGKRKGESVRKRYYAMRKRICNEPFDVMAINLLSEPSTSNFGDGNELLSADCRISNPVSNNLDIPGPGFDIGPHAITEFGPHAAEDLQFGVSHDVSFPYEDNNGFDQSKELPLCNLFESEGLDNEGNNACSEYGPSPFRNFACSSSSLPQMLMWNKNSPDMSANDLPTQTGEQDQQTGETYIITEDGNANMGVEYLAELSNVLFDDLFLEENNVKEPLDKSYYDGFSSLLLDSPSQSESPSGQAEVAADEHLLGTSDAHFGNNEQNKVSDPQVSTSTCNVKALGPEYRNGVICCTLNTEDPEIPSNEDVFLPFRCPSPSYSPRPYWRSEDSSYLASSSIKDLSSARKANGGPPVMKLNNKKDSCGPSRTMGSSDKGLKNPIGDQVVKFELPKSNIQHAALRSAKNVEGNPSRISSANVTANCYIGGVVKLDRGKNIDYDSVGVCLEKHEPGLDVLESLQKNVEAEISYVRLPNAELSCHQKTTGPQAVDNSQLSDEEEWSENDVPYFSDVEAMILDMDLSPDEFFLYTNPEVQRYLHEESKRTIIRLEQAADACTQRAIASQCAFAVLYGRWSKHFIKKPEVIVGRATEDNKVDIDLGREKNGGKISRRQAIIKMDMHGIFHLINVGKSSIHVNGKEVLPGQSINLNPGCLIEVKGLAYIFETNRMHVNQYVNSLSGDNLALDHKPLIGS